MRIVRSLKVRCGAIMRAVFTGIVRIKTTRSGKDRVDCMRTRSGGRVFRVEVQNRQPGASDNQLILNHLERCGRSRLFSMHQYSINS